jgi:uridine phosphorylase
MVLLLLHHLGLTSVHEFADVKFICVCGTNERAHEIAKAFNVNNDMRELGRSRFVVYKVQNVIVCSHGMGGPSISICLNELIKALNMACNCADVTFIRVGTSGGIGVPPGTIVCTTEALNEDLEPFYLTNIMGKKMKYPAILDTGDIEEEIVVVHGKTLSTNCFYENQARTDGAFCSFTQDDQRAYIRKLYSIGVRNIEMEIVTFAAIVHRAGLRAVAYCITLVDRLEDQALIPPENIDVGKLISTIVRIVGKMNKGLCRHCLAFGTRRGKDLVTRCELRQHDRAEDLWIVAGDRVFGVSEFLLEHPGGQRSLLKRGGGAMDCLEDLAFHSQKGRWMWDNFQVARLVECAPG